MAVKTSFFDGAKSFPLNALDASLFPELFETTELIDEIEAYRLVAWIYRAVQLRANALSSIPFKVTTPAGEEMERLPFQDTLPALLHLTESSLSLHGGAYWLKEVNLVGAPLGMRWMIPTSIDERVNDREGLIGFWRKLGTRRIPLDVEQVVYFWLPDPFKELGPGQAPAQVALQAAGLAHNINRFASSFFERGAINPTILTVAGNPNPEELMRLEGWWKRLVGGVKSAWETVAVRSEVTINTLAQDLSDMAMPELNESTRQQMATAFGIPQTMLSDAANFATAKEHRISFWRDTIIPEATWIAGTLNTQLFHPMGLEFDWVFEDVEVLQQDEQTKTEGIGRLTELGIISPMEAREMLNIEMRSEGGEAEPALSDEARMLDLDRWRKVAISEFRGGRNPGRRMFKSDYIPRDQHEAIQLALLSAESQKEVRAAFNAVTFPAAHSHGWESYP